MRIVVFGIFGSLVALLAGSASAGDAQSGAEIRQFGLEARLDADVRDARIRQLAAHLEGLSAERALALQDDFQYAFLLQCDPDVYATLAPGTIEAVDNALEACFDLAEIDRGNRWEPLIYTYGFFNRDVTPSQIQDVLQTWAALSPAEKAPRYPTYIHVIDAVCKPVSMGPVGDHETTRAVLEQVVPAMKQQFLRPPAPGTAFHPASHACLVLGPLYERWVNDPGFGPLIQAHLGDRAAFEALLASQLPGPRHAEAPLSGMEYGYYSYIGSYLANALARLNARSAIPGLAQSLGLYEAREDGDSRAARYTRRALLALGQSGARTAFEARLADPEQRDACIETLVWLARNGQGETRTYAMNHLGALLDRSREHALEAYFTRELKDLRRST